MHELDNQQRLFMVESAQLYQAWIEALRGARSYRYGIKWVRSKGRQYLVRLHDARGNGKSLGPRTAETEAIHEAFVQGRARAQARLKSLSAQLERQSRLNRAARIGRLPDIVGDILLNLAAESLHREFSVIGTHAIYAYEAMAGVHCRMDLLASGDVDLLYDPRRRLSIAAGKMDMTGLLGLLRKTDSSFELVRNEPFRVANSKGFMVDLVIPARDLREAEKVTFGQEDLVAVEVPNLQWLINAPKEEVVAISANGRPVMMRVPDPRAFALHKAWLSAQPDREPVKKPRDHDQAAMVVEMVLKYLPGLAFVPAELRFFSKDMLDVAQRALDGPEGFRFPEM